MRRRVAGWGLLCVWWPRYWYARCLGWAYVGLVRHSFERGWVSRTTYEQAKQTRALLLDQRRRLGEVMDLRGRTG